MRTARLKSISERGLLWACVGLSGVWGAFALAADETATPAVPVGEGMPVAEGSVPQVEETTAAGADTEGAETAATTGVENASASATPGPPPAEAAVPLEEALDEESGPLDGVAFSIEQAEYEGTEEFLERYIRAIETAHHGYHPDLVEPLTLLGDSLFGQQRLDPALETYDRALHVRRVNDGLFAPEQVALVYRQSDVLQAMGNGQQAGNREEYAYSVLLKAYGPSSEEILPGTYRLAEWYRTSFNIFAARAMYERALHIYEANNQQASLSALPALKGLVFTYRQERFPPYYAGDNRSSSFGAAPMPLSSRGTVFAEQITINNFPAAERALQHIVSIRREDPGSSPLEVFEAILDLADWHLMWEHYNKAHTLYEFVFAQLDELDSVDAGAYFAEPRLLHMPLPADPKPPRNAAGEAAAERASIPGFIEASFRVSTNGSAKDIEIVAADPEELMDFRTRRSVRNCRYRPAMANGKAIPFENQTWRHEFQYIPREAGTGNNAEEDDA